MERLVEQGTAYSKLNAQSSDKKLPAMAILKFADSRRCRLRQWASTQRTSDLES
jgi:hypothetical protein